MLKEKYKDFFKVGVAVSDKTIESHDAIIKEHFNSITCENEMKYSSVTEQEGIYDFKKADKIVEFAKENNLLVRGHTFAWHNQTPVSYTHLRISGCKYEKCCCCTKFCKRK